MASSRRMVSVGLGLGVLCTLTGAQAQSGTAGVTVQLVGPSDVASATDWEAHLSRNAIETLRPVVKGPVVMTTAPPAPADWLDDLRLLPQRLQALADNQPGRFPTRYVLSIKLSAEASVSRAGDDRVTGVAALVDRERPSLLGYTTLDASQATATQELSAALAEFVKDTLAPAAGSRSRQAGVQSVAMVETATQSPNTVATPPQPKAQPTPRPAVPDLTPVRDALGEVTMVRRPGPGPAPVPGASVAAPGTSQQVLAVTKLPPKSNVRPDMDALLQQYAGGALNTTGMGSAASRPRVYEASHVVLLLPAPDQDGVVDPQAQPLKATCTLYSTADDYQVEVRFSRSVPTKVVGCQSGWTIWEVPGYQLESEVSGELGPGGLMSLHIRSTDGGRQARFGIHLRGVKAAPMAVIDGGNALLARGARPSEDESDTSGGSPLGDDYQVIRSFTGRASWYGSGQRTANGEWFNPKGMTAAHRSLPMGSVVRVTNLSNGRDVILRINDRGPFVGGRVLDVSYGAAQALGFVGQGVCSVRVDVLSSN